MSEITKINLNGTEYTIGATSSPADKFRDSAYLFKLKNSNEQGMCTDGTYAYSGTTTRIYKYNILTKALTYAEFEENYYGSCNDMTYNPNDGNIYIACGDASKGVGVVKASDLTHVNFIPVVDGNGAAKATWMIAYDRKNNQYIGGSSADYIIYDSQFNYVKTVSASHGGTHQGVETDGTYIYKCRSGVSGRSIVQVIDFDGGTVAQIDVTSNELESITWDWSGNWYCNTKNSQGLYYTSLVTAVGLDAVAQLHKILDAYGA